MTPNPHHASWLRPWTLTLWMLASLTLTSCGEDPAEGDVAQRPSCETAADCPSGEVCEGGACASATNNAQERPVVCGDGRCDVLFEQRTCPRDCPPICGDGFCTRGEAGTCTEDCGAVCGDGLCEVDETFDNCPDDCEPPPRCEAAGDLCEVDTVDNAELTCLLGADSTQPGQARCVPRCNSERGDLDCPEDRFCDRGFCLTDNCTQPGLDPVCATQSPEGGTCQLEGRGVLYCRPPGQTSQGEVCDASSECAAGLGCVDRQCAPLCRLGEDTVCGAQRRCLALLDDERTGVCGEACAGFDDLTSCGEGRRCLPLGADQGVCQDSGAREVGEPCDQDTQCGVNAHCQAAADDQPRACRTLCDVRDDEPGCAESGLCLARNTAAGGCFEACEPFEDDPTGGCAQGGFQLCLPLESASRGVCLRSGEGELNSSCIAPDAPTLGSCAPGLGCLPGVGTADTGQCRPLCAPFTQRDGLERGACSSGNLCEAATAQWGICREASPSSQVAPYAPCSNPGRWCGEERLCVAINTDGDGQCLPVCRLALGSGDCPAQGDSQIQCAAFFSGRGTSTNAPGPGLGLCEVL